MEIGLVSFNRRIILSVIGIVTAWLLMIFGIPAETDIRHFFYLSDQRVVTVERINEQKIILNYINLSDEFELVRAPMLVFVDSEGKNHRGHLIEVEEPADPLQMFKVSDLLKPHAYRGYTILGDFKLQAPVSKVYFKVGSRTLELEPVSKEDFELVAARITQIDLESELPGAAVREAGFHRGHGELHSAGSETAQALEKLFPELELVQPVLLASPPPKLPSSAAGLPDPVVVKISALVSRAGGVHELKVEKGLNATLDALALETVRNSWKFLPAISKGEVADARLTLNVVFQR